MNADQGHASTGAPAGSPDAGDSGAEAVLRLLGLARRAGKLEVGFSAVERMAARYPDTVVLVARNMGAAQRHRVENWQVRRVVTLPVTSEDLGRAMGRKVVAVTGLRDAGFAKGIAKLGL